MFKKVSKVTLLSAALLFSSLFATSVQAAASAEQEANPSYNKENTQVESHFFFKHFFTYYAPQWKQEQTPEMKNDVTKEEQEEKSEEEEENQEEKQDKDQNNALSAYEQKVVELTNIERTKQGLAPFEIDTELSKVAREKSRDMAAQNYFAHESPTYGSPFDMMRSFNIDYRTAGENIAKGQETPEEVVQAWMNSEGHRANILNGNFTHIGVGFIEQGNHWTQQFIGK